MKTRNKSKLIKQSKAIRVRRAPKQEKQDKPETKNAKSHIPDVLFTEDGTIFHPCKNCCRAFAQKTDLLKHQIFCFHAITFKEFSPTLPLPLNSVENTMNGSNHTHQSSSSSSSELNNNRNNKQESPDTIELDYEPLPDTKLTSPQKIRENEKLLKVKAIPNGITTFDLKTKAKIAKILNNSLENNGFSVIVMGNGDIVTKMHATNDYPQMEFITRCCFDKETNADKLNITLRRSGSGGSKGEENYDPPEIPKLLETIFGEDDLFTNLVEEEVKPQTEDVIIHIDEEHFPTDDQVMSMAGEDGTIILEDLDIHICKQCGAVYHTLEDLVQHDKYDHRNIKRKYSLEEIEKSTLIFKNSVDNKCPICSKRLKGKGCWPRHAQSHSEVGMFECKICKKRFSRDDHRKNHEARHVVNID